MPVGCRWLPMGWIGPVICVAVREIECRLVGWLQAQAEKSRMRKLEVREHE